MVPILFPPFALVLCAFWRRVPVLKEVHSSLESSEPYLQVASCWFVSGSASSTSSSSSSGTDSSSSSPGTGLEALVPPTHLLLIPLVWCQLALECLQDPYSGPLHTLTAPPCCCIHSLIIFRRLCCKPREVVHSIWTQFPGQARWLSQLFLQQPWRFRFQTFWTVPDFQDVLSIRVPWC